MDARLWLVTVWLVCLGSGPELVIGMPVSGSDLMTHKDVLVGIDLTGAPFQRHSEAPVMDVPLRQSGARGMARLCWNLWLRASRLLTVRKVYYIIF